MDSGCSNHMTGTRSLFKELDENQKSEVRFGDDRMVKVEGKCTVDMKTSQGNVKLLHDVQYVPSLNYNLLSVGQLMKDGYYILFDGGICSVYDNKLGKYIARIPKASNRMFPLDVSSKENCALTVKASESNLWHLRYGHLNVRGLKLLAAKKLVIGLPEIDDIDLCKGCVYGKQSRKSFPVNKAWKASNYLKLVHADVCGPMSVESLGGSQYFLLFIDDYSRMSWVYFLKLKSETFENFKHFKALVEKQRRCPLKTLHSDRGGQFNSNEFAIFCKRNGIHGELTAAYTPQQNGVVERKNQTVVEMARSMITATSLPKQFWAEAVATVVYVLNISPTKAVMNRTPYEAWKYRKPWIPFITKKR